MRFLLSLLLLTLPAAAQKVVLENLAAAPFSGWVRTTIDRLPPHTSGEVGSAFYVVGGQKGDSLWALDVKLDLAAGQRKVLHLEEATAKVFTPAALPSPDYFGGPLLANGTPMDWVSIELDGAALVSELQLRLAGMMHARVFLRWYPDRPEWAAGELLVTASNPAVPDLTQSGVRVELAFGDALAIYPGVRVGQLPIQGETFSDGQARLLPVTFAWPRHLTSADLWSSVGVVSNLGLSATGIEKLLPDGTPEFGRAGGRQWAARSFSESIRRLHTWEPALYGPASSSPVTGAQEDQVFVRAEAFAANGPGGADIVTYLNAAKMANRPCHFLERDGRVVDRLNHLSPRLVMWDGRPHPVRQVSPDRLGKTGDLASWDIPGGWWGPDVEHLLLNTLAAGHRYTGSPGLAKLIEHQDHIYMLQMTTQPGLSTTQPYASRATGWEGIAAVHMFRETPNRALANRVRDHARERMRKVIIPAYVNGDGVWDIRLDDARLGQGRWWMPWQNSIGAYGLDLMARVFDVPEAIPVAMQAALVCVERNWVKLPGETAWRSVGNQPYNDGVPLPIEHFTNPNYVWGPTWFATTWDVPALVTVLRHQPQHEKALSIWAQVSAGGPTSWFPPR